MVFTLDFRSCDPSFPTFLLGTRNLQEGHDRLDRDSFSVYSLRAIRLFPERPVFTRYTTGSSCGDTLLCLLLNFQQPLEKLELNTPRVFMTIDRNGECTMRRICLPPFPVSCPGAILCRTACFCYASCVTMRRATRSGSSDSFPCP